jgi:predicted AlkP superfamily pyrophosphatase or phosphodiesterase
MMVARRAVCSVRGGVFLAALVLGCAEPDPAPKVLLIGLDGVRVDILAQAHTPNIDVLADAGLFSDEAWTGEETVSGPGWSSMVIGVWADKHGVHNNDFTENVYHQYPDFLTRLEQVDSSFNTFAVLDWPPLGELVDGGPLFSDAIDVKISFDGEEMGYDVADSLSVLAAIDHLTNADPDAAFVYLGYIDIVGHDTSSLDPLYLASIEAADIQVGQLLAAVRARATYDDEDWLILMSTDHGRSDNGGHGDQSLEERTIFYLASGSTPDSLATDRPDGPFIVDVAVTALDHLGVAIDPVWGLDGVVRR